MPVVMDDVRKLATVERITNIRPIEGADAIVQANVRGWPVVIRKGEFSEGELVIYFEPDTALPLSDERFAFLAPRGMKTVEGVDYHVLKTARLRGVYSQGLVLPVDAFLANLKAYAEETFATTFPAFTVSSGDDVTAALGLGKWEAPLPVGNGDAAGPFLTKYARKTDSERLQNLIDVWPAISAAEWDITEKVDGTSCTVAMDGDFQLHVMGRNWEIREGDNTYWNVVKAPRFAEVFAKLEPGEALQMEIAGVGIQGNKLKLQDVRPFIFDYVRDGEMVPRSEWPEVFRKWAVPVVPLAVGSDPFEVIAQVDGMKSLINPSVLAEGVVFHTRDGGVLPEVGNRNTFKVISNAFLAKAKD